MAKKKLKAKKKIAAKKKAARKKKAAVKTKAAARKATIRRKKRAPAKARPRGAAANVEVRSAGRRGLGSEAAGQAGDLQGISRRASADSESVEELLEEGQSLEAEAVSGVEDALDPDESEVVTREVPEDELTTEDGEE